MSDTKHVLHEATRGCDCCCCYSLLESILLLHEFPEVVLLTHRAGWPEVLHNVTHDVLSRAQRKRPQKKLIK